MVSRFVFCLITLGVLGCGSKQLERVPLHPLSGKVLVDGRPVANVEIKLRPVDYNQDKPEHRIAPNAKTNSKGEYKISTYGQDDGAPVGDYLILATWPSLKIEGGEEIFGPDRLSMAYGQPAKPAGKVTVKEGDNTIPTLNLRSTSQ